MNIDFFQFQEAIPVWQKGKSTVINHTLDFKATLPGKKDYHLYLSGSSSYIVFINGHFLAHGPARAAEGFYKVDCFSLQKYLTKEDNLLLIRCTGYNVNSFCYIDAPSFLCAEVRLGNDVIVSTASGMQAYTYHDKLSHVQRYSYQRTMSEVYHLGRKSGENVALETLPAKSFLIRDVPYGEYRPLRPLHTIQCGKFTTSNKNQYYAGREIVNISDNYKGYHETELERGSHIEYGKLDFSIATPYESDCATLSLNTNEYIDLDMGANQTGLFSFDVDVTKRGTFFLAFDELMNDNTLDAFRNRSTNVLLIDLEPGSYHFVSAEPYGMKYIRLIAKDTDVTIRNFCLLEIAFPESNIITKFQSEDDTMHMIFEAAKRSFRANVVDIYMDCPTRERAGWLCDSFFTARAEKVLTGKSEVEKSFLKSFLLPDSFQTLASGLVPMCYPADVLHGEFIPNWAMWYALELYEYYMRTDDRALIDDAKQRLEHLLVYFQSFENDMGLLENLDGVIFVDASHSNKLAWEHAISFPTNMLYAAFQSVLGILYDRSELIENAKILRRLILKYAETESGFFRDCADTDNGKLILCEECTESCQYYAFFFGIVTPETRPKLWDTLIRDFGYGRKNTQKYTEIAPANAFIGNYLRLDLLEQYGYTEELYDNIRGYFSYMAEKTGTLWEYISPTASCNHGYTSHVVYWMHKLNLLK